MVRGLAEAAHMYGVGKRLGMVGEGCSLSRTGELCLVQVCPPHHGF